MKVRSTGRPITTDCLLVLYLASVVIRYGWISDTKFQKFLDKDWIWISKNYADMDQESKNQYLLTFAKQSVLHINYAV